MPRWVFDSKITGEKKSEIVSESEGNIANAVKM